MDKISFQEFKEFLLTEIQENFPTIKLYTIANGDHIANLVMEARTYNGKIRFCPYELWYDNPEDKIKDLFELLDNIV